MPSGYRLRRERLQRSLIRTVPIRGSRRSREEAHVDARDGCGGGGGGGGGGRGGVAVAIAIAIAVVVAFVVAVAVSAQDSLAAATRALGERLARRRSVRGLDPATPPRRFGHRHRDDVRRRFR